MNIIDRGLFPDPALTANIYCAGGLDTVLFQGIAPFWQEFRTEDTERLCYLWVMRYSRGGEHLKVRVHGPEHCRPLQRRLLEERVSACLSALPECSAPPPREGARPRPPAIDVEDHVDGDHPDRTLLWTTYERNAVSLGGKPFLSHDRYAALFTRCLAAGCELVLAQDPGAAGPLPHQLRQSTLLKALAAGLGALPLSPAERADYHAYHRDWLLRSSLPRERRWETGPVEQLCQYFDQQIAKMGDSLSPLRKLAAREAAKDGPEAAWRDALVRLWEYVVPFCTNPDYRLDPFASHPAYTPVFKVCHGLGNQLGLKMTDEAFTHHLLFRIAQTSGSGLEQKAG